MTKYLSDLYENPAKMQMQENSFLIKGEIPFDFKKKKRVNLLALGDVGSTLLIGLRLLGGEVIDSIGICDLNAAAAQRFEMEINQIEEPLTFGKMPEVEIIKTEQLFDCDVIIFCASKSVPPVGGDVKDVRMAQLSANTELVRAFASRAVKANFKGLFAVVSDPVDPLCKAALLEGLSPDQIQGYGLGVMNGRALYYAKKDPRFQQYANEGRAFGPHGQDLVIANSIAHYDNSLSKELTALTVQSNLKTRELGFKPYIAPALSSGALSILATLKGEWNYSSSYFGNELQGAFLGARNRRVENGIEVENLPLQKSLFNRIQFAYENLKKLI